MLLTGVSRQQYAAFRDASAAAYREALAILDEYRSPDSSTTRPPALSEIHIDPHYGFSLVLYDGGAEIRLGRGDYTDKLERLDRILAGLPTFGAHGLASLQIVHLDGPNRDRVPVRLAAGAVELRGSECEAARSFSGWDGWSVEDASIEDGARPTHGRTPQERSYTGTSNEAGLRLVHRRAIRR